MKKSELKQLIREVIEEAEAAQLNDMVKALEQNPKFVDDAWEKLQAVLANIQLGKRKANQLKKGGTLSEQDMQSRDYFIKNLATALLDAGQTPAQVLSANTIGNNKDIIISMARSQMHNLDL
jgi:hypothetical protein